MKKTVKFTFENGDIRFFTFPSKLMGCRDEKGKRPITVEPLFTIEGSNDDVLEWWYLRVIHTLDGRIGKVLHE